MKVSALDILSLRNYVAGAGRLVLPYLVECISDGKQEVSRHETLVLRDDHLSSGELSRLSESLASLSLANAGAFPTSPNTAQSVFWASGPARTLQKSNPMLSRLSKSLKNHAGPIDSIVPQREENALQNDMTPSLIDFPIICTL